MRPTRVGGPTLWVNPSGGGPGGRHLGRRRCESSTVNSASASSQQQVASNKQAVTNYRNTSAKTFDGWESLPSDQVGLEWDSPRSAGVGYPVARTKRGKFSTTITRGEKDEGNGKRKKNLRGPKGTDGTCSITPPPLAHTPRSGSPGSCEHGGGGKSVATFAAQDLQLT